MRQVLLSLTLLLLPMFMMIQGCHAHSHGHDHDHDHDHDHGHEHHHHDEDKDMKKGILLAAFGSSYPQAQPALDNIEKMTKEAFPEVPVRWAYTSRMVRHSLAKKDKHFDSPAMALARMEDEGFTHVAVMSLHTIGGVEFHELRSVVGAFQDMQSNLKQVSLSSPLLGSPDVMERVRDSMLDNLPADRKADEAVIWVGHGSYHPSNAFYQALAYKLQRKDENVFMATLGCLGGSPSFEDVKEEVKAKGIDKAYLVPFMSVVGAHTIRDVAGKDNSGHDHSHDHGHEHNHDHEHNHSHDHGHDHDHDHNDGHGHDHNHDHNHNHGHDHGHNHDHGHDHDHDHHHGDPWKQRLQDAGIETEVVLKGTGEYDDFVNIWLDQLKKAVEQLH